MAVVETLKRVLGEHPDTFTSMANLAYTYWDQRRWKEAEALKVAVMETRKRVLGEAMVNTTFSNRRTLSNTRTLCDHYSTITSKQSCSPLAFWSTTILRSMACDDLTPWYLSRMIAYTS